MTDYTFLHVYHPFCLAQCCQRLTTLCFKIISHLRYHYYEKNSEDDDDEQEIGVLKAVSEYYRRLVGDLLRTLLLNFCKKRTDELEFSR